MAPSWESRFRGVVAGVIEAGVAVKANSSEMWAELRPRLEEAGLPIGREGVRLVGTLWSQARARREGAARFQRAKPGALFDTTMAPPAMNMRSSVVRQMMPEYQVRFDLTYTDPTGAEATKTVTMRDVWRPGMTVADVHDAVAEAAEGMAMDYGTGFSGVANLRPVMI